MRKRVKVMMSVFTSESEVAWPFLSPVTIVNRFWSCFRNMRSGNSGEKMECSCDARGQKNSEARKKGQVQLWRGGLALVILLYKESSFN